MTIVTPALTLGVAVHEVLEGLGDFPSATRLDRNLRTWFEDVWKKSTGIVGGFTSEAEEAEYKARGERMIQTVVDNPRFLGNKIIKLPRSTMNPNFYLDEEQNIILNGLVDWIEYLPETDSLHIVDFKTGKHQERDESLQLPIYLLLCDRLQKRKVTRASYWYLESDTIQEKNLPTVTEALDAVLPLARRVAAARKSQEFTCPRGASGCFHCEPLARIAAMHRGEALTGEEPKFVGIGTFKQELYVVR